MCLEAEARKHESPLKRYYKYITIPAIVILAIFLISQVLPWFYFAFGNMDKGEVSMGWRQLIDDMYTERLNTGRLFLTSPRWKGYQLSTSLIYDLKTENRIEETYTIFYKHVCWKASLAFIRQIDEDLVRANLNIIF